MLRVEIHRIISRRGYGHQGVARTRPPSRTIQHPFSCGYDSSAVWCTSHVAVADMSSACSCTDRSVRGAPSIVMPYGMFIVTCFRRRGRTRPRIVTHSIILPLRRGAHPAPRHRLFEHEVLGRKARKGKGPAAAGQGGRVNYSLLFLLLAVCE